MSDSTAYLHELRRALPFGCRRRFVAEVREHFESAAAAEATHGVDRQEAERLTIERLGPPHALADQLLTDLRSGALGPVARLSAALTTTRVALGALLVIAVVVGIAVTKVRSSSTPPSARTVQRAPRSSVVRNGVTIRRVIITVGNAQQSIHIHTVAGGYVVPVRFPQTQRP